MGNGEALKDFIREQLTVLDLSIREFAELCDVSHSTIVRLIAERPEKRMEHPDLSSVIKIANATHTDLITVLALAYPEEMAKSQLSPQSRLIAQRLERLPEQDQRKFKRLIDEAVKISANH